MARAQILLTALHRYDIPAPYKPTYAKYPSVSWMADSIDHQRWLIEFVKALCREATRRYEKITLRKRSSMSCHPSRSCLKPDGRNRPRPCRLFASATIPLKAIGNSTDRKNGALQNGRSVRCRILWRKVKSVHFFQPIRAGRIRHVHPVVFEIGRESGA